MTGVVYINGTTIFIGGNKHGSIVTYADAAKNAQEVRDRYYTRAFTFYIPFETAQTFRSRDNTFLRRGQWTDLLVEVYVRTKKL